MMSASAWVAMRARSRLCDSPATEKMGIFWLSTRQLKTSIMGIFVRIMFFGTMRVTGLTEGPPIST